MELNPIRFGSVSKKRETKTFFVMRALGLLTILISLTAFSQSTDTKISLSVSNAPIETVFKEIKRQTGYEFVYTRSQIKKSVPVTVQLQSASLNQALEICFKEQPFTYVIEGSFIAVKERSSPPEKQTEKPPLSGRVLDENGNPVEGATIQVKGSAKATSTDAQGVFSFPAIDEDAILIISSIGYGTKEISVKGKSLISVTLDRTVTKLDETIVIAYGTTTQRLNTGSVGKITSKEIENQPVSNPLATLQGRIPGLLVTQTSGISGSAFKVEIRGQSSVGAYSNAPYPVGNEPLYIIDGIPYTPGNKLNQVLNASTTPGDARSGGLSPLNLINPSAIESIEVLKDADATAIYGSRGANGVILITTKKGKAGKSKFEMNVYSGGSRITRTPDLLTTSQYIAMRREAFRNDVVTPTSTNAPDLLVFDTTSYTDFRKQFYEKSAMTFDVQATYSGGNKLTQFLFGAGYHVDGSLIPGDFKNQRPSMYLNLNHATDNNKFRISFSSNYSYNNNNLTSLDLTQLISGLPPNIPILLDANGELQWEYKGAPLFNPYAYLFQKYESRADNLMSNLSLYYEPVKNLQLKASFGFNNVNVSENRTVPAIAQNPQGNPSGYAEFSNKMIRSWIVEPYAEYKKVIGTGKLNLMVGSTAQQFLSRGDDLTGTNYSSDALLFSISSAGNIIASSMYNQYRYLGFFGKINYDWKDKIIINLSGRRDGSSRFGSGNQFSNFGAYGIAWVFSKEKFVARGLPLISFGKLRTSFGVTGNDQIGDYIYLDSWTPTTSNYQGQPGIRPVGLFNPDFGWEMNRKLEFGLDLGFLKDKVLFGAAFYRNRSSNQLVNYRLPVQAGFSSLRAKNFPALVQNAGLELSISSELIKRKTFLWTTAFNLTVPKNKLLAFPGIERSSYASIYVVGQSLSVARGYHYLGIDPQTGIYQFEDLNHDNKLSSADYEVIANMVPRYYGGFSNSLLFHQVKLDFFMEFKKQLGRNISYYQTGYPGQAYNQPAYVMERWQKPGDITTLQKFTTTPGTPAFIAAQKFISSDGVITDASYLRLKNLSLSYLFPENMVSKMGIQSARLYINSQNLLTLTHYPGDPETQNYKVMPPLRTITLGIQLTL